MTNQFVCILLLLIAATSTYAESVEGGVAVKSSDREYVVQIVGSDGTLICGGVLYNNVSVITAGACMAFYVAEELRVAVNNKQIAIADYHYNGFDFITNENDIALLKLAEPVSVTKYVKLPRKKPVTGSTAVLTGLDAKNSLVDVTETLISAKDCGTEKYGHEEGEIIDTMLCATPKNGCGGVPGNPLLNNDQLIGVASASYGCGAVYPAIFTNVYKERSWIKSTVKKW